MIITNFKSHKHREKRISFLDLHEFTLIGRCILNCKLLFQMVEMWNPISLRRYIRGCLIPFLSEILHVHFTRELDSNSLALIVKKKGIFWLDYEVNGSKTCIFAFCTLFCLFFFKYSFRWFTRIFDLSTWEELPIQHLLIINTAFI